ncbi:hypothetical protein ABT160_16900 [Streptomyces sp. NPDC001941]|uniref:hypothetical protein n=1 Tax=Streptomyces sp. NPDC001941 TaxID=3154659 RepID=UPI003323FFF1
MGEDEELTPLERHVARELRELGRGLRTPEVDGADMAARVLGRIADEGAPVPVAAAPGRAARALGRLLRRRRALAASLSGVLVVVALTPPVRAAVADWLGLGGVAVRYDPSAPSPELAAVPGCAPSMGLADAARLAGFAPRVPVALGEPDAVAVVRAGAGRTVVSLCWGRGAGTVRLDEFSAELDGVFGKTVRVAPEWVELGRGRQAYWFAAPHELVLPLREGGGTWDWPSRTAGPTLLWTRDALTFRLEGEGARAAAVEVARSVP